MVRARSGGAAISSPVKMGVAVHARGQRPGPRRRRSRTGWARARSRGGRWCRSGSGSRPRPRRPAARPRSGRRPAVWTFGSATPVAFTRFSMMVRVCSRISGVTAWLSVATSWYSPRRPPTRSRPRLGQKPGTALGRGLGIGHQARDEWPRPGRRRSGGEGPSASGGTIAEATPGRGPVGVSSAASADR